MSKTKRAYKYRFYPTAEQKRILAQTFGCCRFVYNWGLSTRKTAYFQHGQKLTSNDLSAMLPALKKEHPWLSDVSSVPIQQALRHLDRAYKNFAESGTTAISTPQETFWPRGSRCLPVEEVSDLSGRKLERATPNEAGKPVREDGKPPPFRAYPDNPFGLPI